MSCLSFSNNYFDKAIVTVQDSFTRDVRDTYFENSLENYSRNLNLIYIGRSEKEIMKDCYLVLVYEMWSQGLLFDFRNPRTEKFV